MSIYEACETIKGLMVTAGCNLIVCEDVNGNMYCHLDDCYIKNGVALDGTPGRGRDLIDAIGSYLELVKGKAIVVHPSGKNRKEIYVM